MATSKDISIDQGSEYIEHILIQDAEGTAIDLVADSYTARMKVKSDYNTAAGLVFDMTTANGMLELHRGGVTGRLSIVLSEADSSAITVKGRIKDCVYDLELVDSGSVPTRLYEGAFTIVANVTE